MPPPPDQNTLTVTRALRTARERLRAAGLESPDLDADVLLRHVLGWDRTQLFMRANTPVGPAALAAYEALLARRLAGEPVAYLTGVREFMGLPFAVSPAVLAPRPETEILVEWAAARLRERGEGRVIDVGTGSGAIALSLAEQLGAAWRGAIVAVDVSPAALAVAARNRATFGLETRVALRPGDLLRDEAGPFDLVLANLPYLRPAQVDGNPDLAAEPRLALDGGADGLDLIRALLADAPRTLAPGGALGLEIDPSQAAAVAALGAAAFPGARVTVLPDLAGWARHVVIETAPATS